MKIFSKISEKKTEIRKKKIGLIFQQFYLIPNYTALENVMFPMQLNKFNNEEKKATSILSDIGLADKKIIYLQNYQRRTTKGSNCKSNCF